MDTVQPQQNKPADQQGTGFTNLSQYLNANQNNQLGNVVGGGIQAAGQAATGAINNANQTFQSGVNTEQNRISGLGTDVSNTLGSLDNGIKSSDVSNFQSALSGVGQGPTGLANTDKLTQQANDAQAQGAATSSQAGRYGLLQNYVGKGQQYGLGQQTLDSALLGQTSQQQLGQARAATANLGGQANQAIAAANAQGQTLANQATQLQANTQNQIGQAVTGYDKGLSQRLTADNANTNNILSTLNGTAGNSAINLDQNTLSQLSAATGGLLGSGTNLYNTNLSPYLQANNLYATNQGVQTQADFAKAQALAQLAGNNGLAGTSQGSVLQNYLANPSMVGQYAANSPFSVTSQSGLSDALKNASNSYNSQAGQQENLISGANANVQNDQSSLVNLYNTANGNPQTADDLQSALAWGANPTNSASGLSPAQIANNNYRAQTLLGQIQANNAQEASSQQQLAALGNQFDINRILGLAPATGAANATPILGNNGQPLTS